MSQENKTINPLEKKIILVALLASAIHLGLIAFAVYRYGVTVPDCLPNGKPLTKGSLEKLSDGVYEAHFLAKMWGFEPYRIRLPLHSQLKVFVTSADVVHGMNVVGTAINLMALPGVINYAQSTFHHPGTYPIICHEYCGVGHHGMYGYIEVGSDIKVASMDLSGAPPAAKGSGPGLALLKDKGCVACHSLDGQPGIGPTFKGAWGRKEFLADGTEQVVDENYLRESIANPSAKIVKGFQTVPMPALPVSEAEVNAMVEYLKNN